MSKSVIQYIALGVIAFLTAISACTSCMNQSRIQKLDKKISQHEKEVDHKLDSFKQNIDSNTYSKEELRILEYRISKNILYDWNAVVRTKIRPDDRMNYYDEKINEIKNNN